MEDITISKYNPEHYLDMTAYEALRNLDKENKKGFRPIVYICSPFAGDTERNVQKARGYSRFAVSKGVIPLAPHLIFPQFMDDSHQEERETALFMGMVLLTKCRELWCFGDKRSPGMMAEIEKAKLRSMNIRYFNEFCVEVGECTR